MAAILPTKEQAQQFALMLTTGIPPAEAMRYFLPDEALPDVVVEMAERWARCADVRAAIIALNDDKAWSELTPEERIKKALEKHYNEMAFFLYSTNYIDLDGAKKQKADSCRSALETKLAGMAGKMDALSSFYMDMVEKAERAKKKQVTH